MNIDAMRAGPPRPTMYNEADYARPDKPDQKLVVWGWITTAFLAPVGLVIGIVLLVKGNRKGHGGAMLALGIAWLIMIGFVIANALASPTTAMSAGTMATQLEQGFNAKEDGGTVSDATCVEKSDTTFTCMGKWTPDLDAVKKDMPSDFDPSVLGKTWSDYTEPQNASWEVTVAKDGTWIAEPKS
jgi:hypothetical protein